MLSKCLDWLKRDEFKKEIKDVLQPLLEVLIDAIRPYLMYCLAFVIANFTLLLLILFCVMRPKKCCAI